MRAELIDRGMKVSRQRVARLMRLAHICDVSRHRAWVVTACRDKDKQPAPDLVKREFKADGANQLWVTDMTYVPTWTGFIFPAVVLDVWGRRVVDREDRLFKRLFFCSFSFPSAPRTRQRRGGTQRSRCLNLSLDAGCDLLGVDGPAEMRLSGCRLRVTPCRQAVFIGPVATGTQPTPAALRVGPLEQWGIAIVKPLAAPGREPAHEGVLAPADPGA